ncbi:MAG: ABC transporter permease, partial [Candidatus Heimdallarchaeota archaeon]|nr:ABC transporter permease [Candidatus Heimdallarchaeota archaeon]
ENQFSSEIEGVSSIITTQTAIGVQPATVIGIDPTTFFDVVTMDDTYFVDSTVDEIKQSLLTFNENGDYANVVFTSSLANPQTDTGGGGFGGREGGRRGGGFGAGQNTDFLSVYSTGDELPIFRFGNQTTVQISGIVDFIPGISDFLGTDDSATMVMLVNEKFLTSPVTITNTNDEFTLLSQTNASFALISTTDGVESAVFGQEILNWFEDTYPDSLGIDVITFDETLEEYSFKVGAIIGLTTMEWLLVLSISFLGLQIFLTSSLFERKKELSTYFAIGAKVKDIRNLIFAEVLLISVVSLVTGMLMSLIISYMYLGFLSTLVILNIYQLSIPIFSFVLMTILVVISSIVSIMYSISKLAKLDPAQTLRTV